MKKFILFILICVLILTCFFTSRHMHKSENITLHATIEAINDDTILVSTTDSVGFNTAEVSFENDITEKLDFVFEKGQNVEISISPEISGDNPAHVKASAIWLDTSVRDTADLELNYQTQIYRADSISEKSQDFLNSMAQNSNAKALGSIQYLPVIYIDNMNVLNAFKKSANTYFDFGNYYGFNFPMNSALSLYDSSFFESQFLLIICAPQTEDSLNEFLSLDSPIKDASIVGRTLTFSLPASEVIPTDSALELFIVLELDKEVEEYCYFYDAYYDIF